MSEIGFKLTTDASPFVNGFATAMKSVNDLETATNDLESTTKAGFSKATKEVNDFGKEINKGAKGVSDFEKETQKIPKSGNVIKELKKQIKEYTAEAYKAGAGTQAFTDNLAKAGALKDELGDLNAQVNALSGNLGENLAKASSTGLGLVARGFEGVQSASILADTNAKEFEQTMLQLQAFNGLANVAQEFAGIGDKITEIKEGFKPVANLFKSGATSIVDGYGNANDSLKGFFTNFGSNAKSAFKGAGSFIKDFGANALSVAKGAGTGFVSFFSNFGSNMKGFASSAKAGINTVGTAIKANPLGIILTVITLVIAAFVLLKDKVKPITQLFEAIGDAIDFVGDKIEKFAQALGLVSDANEKKKESTIKNTGDEVSAIEKRYDREIKLAQASGKDTTKLELEKARAVTKRIADTIAALEYQRQRNGKLNEEELKQYQDLQSQLKDVANEAQVAIFNQQKEKKQKEEEEAKKSQEIAKERSNKRKQLEKELLDALNDLAKRSEQANLSGLTGEAKLQKEREINLKSITELQIVLEKKSQLAGKGGKLEVEQLEQLNNLKLQVDNEFYQNRLILQIEASNKEAELLKKNSDTALQQLELKNQIAKSNIEKTRALDGATEAQKLIFEEQKNKSLLQLDLKYQQDKLQLTLTDIDVEANAKRIALENELSLLDVKNDKISQIRKKAITQELSDLLTNTELLKQATIASTDNIVAGISDGLNKAKPANKLNISKLLNLDNAEIATTLNVKFNANVNAQDVANAKDALSQLASSLKEIMNAYFEEEQKKLDIELENNQKRIEARDANISSLEDALSAEKDLQDKGLANNVDRLQTAINSQKKAREKELENEKRIKEEKKKLAKEQLIIDTITQGSQLVLAIAQLYGALSGFAIGPVPVGLIVATAAAAAMVSSFAIQKSNAFDAIDSGNFYTGGYTGDGDKYDERGTVHAGEYVMNKATTKKNFKLLDGLHKDDSRLMMVGIKELIKDKGISLIADIPRELNETKSAIKSNEMQFFVNNNNNRGVESRIDVLQKEFMNISKILSNSETVLPNGTRIIKKGSLTTIIKPKQ